MAKQTINLGAAPNDGTGDPIRTAFTKSNDNFTELYTTKQDLITAGTTAQYYRGDKTFQTLDKAAVSLGNVDNTSDANKPVSTATQTALDLKQAAGATLTSLQAATWTTGSQVVSLSAANTVSLLTVGSAAGNILNKAAGDTLYQPVDGTLTAFAGASWTAGKEIATLTAADTVTMTTVGAGAGNILDKAAGDTLYSPVGHLHAATYQPLDGTLTAFAGLTWTAGSQVAALTAADTLSLLTVGAGAGNILDKAAGDSLYAKIGGVVVDATAARTIQVTDASKVVRFTSATAVTVTLPLDATQAVPVGSTITVDQAGAGLVSFVADGAAVIEKRAATLDALGQHSVIRAIKVAADTWLLTGDLA